MYRWMDGRIKGWTKYKRRTLTKDRLSLKIHSPSLDFLALSSVSQSRSLPIPIKASFEVCGHYNVQIKLNVQRFLPWLKEKALECDLPRLVIGIQSIGMNAGSWGPIVGELYCSFCKTNERMNKIDQAKHE
jgi:hypothetical protein